MLEQLLIDSLHRRLRALFSLYEKATATMTVDQVNHREREGILPIAFSLFHFIRLLDNGYCMLTGESPVWDEAWRARVRPHIDDHGKERTVAEMQHQQIGGYPELIDYMRAVFTRTEKWLTQLPPSELERIVIPRPFPPQFESTFGALLAGEKGITVLDGIECWIYQHGLRHMGEIELARSFVGLQGMTS